MNQRNQTRWIAGGTLGLLLWLAPGADTLAVDGVIEINQVRAVAGDVTPGDFGGFPVWINEPGSYRLTSDLVPPPGVDGINIFADDVTIDLNGFGVLGSGEVGSNDGITFSAENVEIRNGTVTGFLRHGIFGIGLSSTQARVVGVRSYGNFADGIHLESAASLVDGCTVFDNSSQGVWIPGDGSLVINSVVRGNGQVGLLLGPRGGYRSNTLTDNNGGNGNPQVSPGIELGANICGNNTVCP
jgi:hypothetical protein